MISILFYVCGGWVVLAAAVLGLLAWFDRRWWKKHPKSKMEDFG